MTLDEMHVWFRQYAQQMGMQNVRAILPEQIDVCINTSISDTVNELVKENLSLTNDRVITDNAKLGQVNCLRPLYSYYDLAILEEGKPINSATLIKMDGNPDDMFVAPDITDIPYPGKLMYIVDFTITYIKGDNKTTKSYPVRFIDNMYLADTLQDFVMKPRVRAPIAVMYGDELHLYLGDDYKKGNGLFGSNYLTPKSLRMGYLREPVEVKYLKDLGQRNVNCDLPAYMHADILKHAVDLYRVSIQGALYANQQQQQAQQRETARNNVRPDNEGYQQ